MVLILLVAIVGVPMYLRKRARQTNQSMAPFWMSIAVFILWLFLAVIPLLPEQQV